jgi:hypothetical protein
MINKRKKQRIKEEEIYRHEVKEELQAAFPKKKNKLGPIFNSNPVSILLATVLIPLGLWIINRHAEKIQKEEKLHKIDIEVSNRLKGFIILRDTFDLVTMPEFYGLIHGHKGPMNYYNSFEELESVSLLSLMIEANSISPGFYTVSQIETVKYSFRILGSLEKNHFYVTKFESYGPGGGSGSLTSIHHKLPTIMANRYLHLLQKNFGDDLGFKSPHEIIS